MQFEDIPGTDLHAVNQSKVSVTPLHLDLTNYRSFKYLATWPLDLSQNYSLDAES